MIPRYTLPEMGALWTDQARFEPMLRVEIAVLDALEPSAASCRRTRSRDHRDRAASTSIASPSSSGPPTTT